MAGVFGNSAGLWESFESLVTHHEVHEFATVEVVIRFRCKVCADECVLDDTNDRLAVTWTNNLHWYCGDFLEFCVCFCGLWNVGVHLITIEIGVICGTYRDVQAKCVEREDTDTMTHHRHTMECWLTIEKDHIAIHEVAVDRISNFENDFGGVDVFEGDHTAITTNDRFGARVFIGTVLDVAVEFIAIVDGDTFWARKIHCNLERHTDFCD